MPRWMVLLLALVPIVVLSAVPIVWSAYQTNPGARAAPVVTAGPTPGAIGSIGHLRNALLWVDDIGLFAWNRAYSNRDQKGQDDAMRLYDKLLIPYNPAVRVTNRTRDAVQVELLEGEYAGRRGWTDANGLIP